MHLETCILPGWLFSPWKLFDGAWLLDVIVLPMGLQTPSVLAVLTLTHSLGSWCSIQWLTMSIYLCICKALAGWLRRQSYQFPVNKHFVVSKIISGLVTVYGMNSQVGQSLDCLSFSTLYLHICSCEYFIPLLRRTEAPTLWSSFFFSFIYMVCELYVGLSEPLG